MEVLGCLLRHLCGSFKIARSRLFELIGSLVELVAFCEFPSKTFPLGALVVHYGLTSLDMALCRPFILHHGYLLMLRTNTMCGQCYA
jgi:hypothetical protein